MSPCFLFCYARCRVSSSSSSSPSTLAETGGDGRSSSEAQSAVPRYSYKKLEKATQGFRPGCKIGEGGFGSVYKGRLEDGAVVAIKVLSPMSEQGETEFLSEIEFMRSIRHENLLQLRGYCANRRKRVLVYDYMEKNSLAQCLLSGKLRGIYFNWAARKKISLGVAHGLAYLHEEVKPHIVHRDIKPSNILLDTDLTPKISDFGMARLFPEDVTHVSTRVAGTLGYLAPEYARCGKLTKKSDVYSFGVLLCEIIGGRLSSNLVIDLHGSSMLEKAWQMYRDEQLIHFVDPSLKGEFPEEEAIQYLKVALLCVQEASNLRPPMSKVAKMLSNMINVGGIRITRPGSIMDFNEIKTRDSPVFHLATSRSSSTTTPQCSPSHASLKSLATSS